MSTRFRARVLSHDDPAFADCLAIRLRVFVDEQRFTVEDEIDGLDEVTTHILLLDRLNNPVGTLRYFPAPKRKLGRLAVLPQFRKTGAATALLYALDEHVRRTDDTPSQRLEAHAQVGSLRFYDRTGWTVEGEPFDEDGQPHVLVWREVPRQAALDTPDMVGAKA